LLVFFFFFSSRRRHTRFDCDWSSDVCSSDLLLELADGPLKPEAAADVALGAMLRAYAFDRYKTKRKEGEEIPAKARVTLGVADRSEERRVGKECRDRRGQSVCKRRRRVK